MQIEEVGWGPKQQILKEVKQEEAWMQDVKFRTMKFLLTLKREISRETSNQVKIKLKWASIVNESQRS